MKKKPFQAMLMFAHLDDIVSFNFHPVRSTVSEDSRSHGLPRIFVCLLFSPHQDN
jgi:hypothetical protein